MNIEQLKELLLQNRSFITKTFHVKEIGVFGSFARGTAASASDIDVLVTFDAGHKDFFNYMRLKAYLEELVKTRVDLVIKEALRPAIKDTILEEVVYV